MGGKWFESPFGLLIIPIGVVRFILFAPLGYYWAHSSTHWSVINDHEILRNGTYNPAIAAAEKIASKWGTFVFYWNFAIWIPSIWFLPPLNFPFAIVDTTATVYIALATHAQTHYVPHSESSCNKGAAHSWHRPLGANESFFEAAARLNATVTTPISMCRSFVEEWQYGIVISFFYSAITLMSIIAFFGSLIEGRRKGESLRQLSGTILKLMLSCLLIIPKILYFFLILVLWYLPEGIFRSLPLKFKSHVRFGRRYITKGGMGAEQAIELEARSLRQIYKERKDAKGRYYGGEGTPSSLSNFLSTYDMLMAVTEQLHYSDIMTLSRTSKSIRNVVLPQEFFEQRTAAFKRYTCLGTPSYGCWMCEKKICEYCRHKPIVPQTTLLHHIYHCKPYCTPCYQTHVLARCPRGPTRQKTPKCICAPRTAHPNLWQRYINGEALYKNAQSKVQKVERSVCRDCNMIGKEELLAQREKKTRIFLLEGKDWEGKKWTKCARLGCDNELGAGPRWWVCKLSTCQKECRSPVHKGWEVGHQSEKQSGDNVV